MSVCDGLGRVGTAIGLLTTQRSRVQIPPPLLVSAAHPQRAATLLLALDRDDRRSLPLLSQWCADQAPVSPARQNAAELTLRRRQSLQRVHAVLVAEDTAPSWVRPDGAPPH
jgi:hypothetical protein